MLICGDPVLKKELTNPLEFQVAVSRKDYDLAQDLHYKSIKGIFSLIVWLKGLENLIHQHALDLHRCLCSLASTLSDLPGSRLVSIRQNLHDEPPEDASSPRHDWEVMVTIQSTHPQAETLLRQQLQQFWSQQHPALKVDRIKLPFYLRS